MIPNPMAERMIRPSPNDRSSRELRAYVRREWGSDVSWIESLAPRRPLRLRMRAWLRGRAEARESRSRDDERPRPCFASLPVSLDAEAGCPHSAAEDLGFCGSARFLRCSLCGGVLIGHDGRWWGLDPAGSPVSDGSIRG